VAWVFESNVNSASPRGTLRRFAIYLVAAVAIPVSVFFSLKPIIRQYFYGTDHLEISGNARLVDVETIDLELVLTSERKKTVVIKSDDISLTLSDLEDKSSSRYPVFFYGPDDNWYTYLVLEPGRPTIVHATAGFRAGPGSQVWPLDKQMLAQMKADICVVNRRASASTYSCIGHQIQGP
jgi:hypothetical protein